MKEAAHGRAALLLLFTTAVWGSTFPVIKALLVGPDACSPFGLLSARFAVASLVGLFVFRSGGAGAWSRRDVLGGALVGLFGFLGYALQAVGLVSTTPAKSGFITSLFVLFVPFVSLAVERVRVPARVFAALPFALLGLWAISGAKLSVLEVNRGDRLTLLAAVFYAFQVVAIQVATTRGDWRRVTLVQLAAMALLSGGAAAFEEPGPVLSLAAPGIAGVLYLAVVATVGALGVQMYAQRLTSSARASLVYIAEPLFAAGFAWAFMGQGMTRLELAGGAGILAAMAIGNLGNKSTANS